MDDASPIEYTKRKYAEVVKSTGIPELEGTIAAQGVKLISELFHLDGLYDKSGDKSRKDYRHRELSPKVDAYFAWVKNPCRPFQPVATPTKPCSTVWWRPPKPTVSGFMIIWSMYSQNWLPIRMTPIVLSSQIFFPGPKWFRRSAAS